MAENTTKDIWNDDDGAKEPPKKRHMLRNFLIFLLVLILVLGIVLVAAWRDGTWTHCGGTLPTAAAPLPVKRPSISSIPTTATALRRWGTEAW